MHATLNACTHANAHTRPHTLTHAFACCAIHCFLLCYSSDMWRPAQGFAVCCVRCILDCPSSWVQYFLQPPSECASKPSAFKPWALTWQPHHRRLCNPACPSLAIRAVSCEISFGVLSSYQQRHTLSRRLTRSHCQACMHACAHTHSCRVTATGTGLGPPQGSSTGQSCRKAQGS